MTRLRNQHGGGWPWSARLTVLTLMCCVAGLAIHSVHPVRRLRQYSGLVMVTHRIHRLMFGVGTLSALAPASAAHTQVTVPPEVLAESQIPRVLMTADYPLNQPITNQPADTRMLKSGNPYTPKPIVESFYQIFGKNHIRVDTTIPVTVIDSRKTPGLTTSVKITTDWGSDDASHVPASGCRIEHLEDPNADHHCIIFDTATGMLHEVFGTKLVDGKYTAAAYRRWNTNKNEHGKPGQNSADAAGLPILPLMLRYSEASTGPVNHAIRFTINLSRANGNGGAFTPPASHAAGQNWSSTAYMGMRMRLRPDFDASGMSPINQTIVTTLKTYGLVLADNGISGLISADEDPRWDAEDLNRLGANMTLNDFIPINSGPIIDGTGQPVQ